MSEDLNKTFAAASFSFSRRKLLLGASSFALAGIALASTSPSASAQQAAAPSGRPPNILILWGDDVGYWNISAYNQG